MCSDTCEHHVLVKVLVVSPGDHRSSLCTGLDAFKSNFKFRASDCHYKKPLLSQVLVLNRG